MPESVYEAIKKMKECKNKITFDLEIENAGKCARNISTIILDGFIIFFNAIYLIIHPSGTVCRDNILININVSTAIS